MTMTLINHTHKIFTQAEAETVAAKLNEDGDGWTYKVENNPNPNGPKTAIIRIYDEDGEEVGLL